VSQQLNHFSEVHARECEQEIEEIEEATALSVNNVAALPEMPRLNLTDFRARAMTLGMFTDQELFRAEEAREDELESVMEESASEVDVEIGARRRSLSGMRAPRSATRARASTHRKFSTATNLSDDEGEDGEGHASPFGAMLGWVSPLPRTRAASRARGNTSQGNSGGGGGIAMTDAGAWEDSPGSSRRLVASPLGAISEEYVSPLHGGSTTHTPDAVRSAAEGGGALSAGSASPRTPLSALYNSPPPHSHPQPHSHSHPRTRTRSLSGAVYDSLAQGTVLAEEFNPVLNEMSTGDGEHDLLQLSDHPGTALRSPSPPLGPAPHPVGGDTGLPPLPRSRDPRREDRTGVARSRSRTPSPPPSPRSHPSSSP
jgi:hypothetical protein